MKALRLNRAFGTQMVWLAGYPMLKHWACVGSFLRNSKVRAGGAGTFEATSRLINRAEFHEALIPVRNVSTEWELSVFLANDESSSVCRQEWGLAGARPSPRRGL